MRNNMKPCHLHNCKNFGICVNNSVDIEKRYKMSFQLPNQPTARFASQYGMGLTIVQRPPQGASAALRRGCMRNPNLHEKTLTCMNKTLCYMRKNPNLHGNPRIPENHNLAFAFPIWFLTQFWMVSFWIILFGSHWFYGLTNDKTKKNRADTGAGAEPEASREGARREGRHGALRARRAVFMTPEGMVGGHQQPLNG